MQKIRSVFIKIVILRIVIASSEKSNHPNANEWNAMLSHLKTVSEFQGMQLDVTIRLPAGHYHEDTLLHTLNNVICQQEQIQGYYKESQCKFRNGESAPFRNPPEFRDHDGHMVLWCNLDDVKYIGMNISLHVRICSSCKAWPGNKNHSRERKD